MVFSNLSPTNKNEFECLIKSIKKEKNLNTLICSYERFCSSFSCKPNREEYPYPRYTDVIDEDKSVKWNREEVDRLRKAFEIRVDELNKWKNLIVNAIEAKIVQILGKDNGISPQESNLIWRYSYSEKHSYGIRDVVSFYEEFVDIYSDLLKIRKENENDRISKN